LLQYVSKKSSKAGIGEEKNAKEFFDETDLRFRRLKALSEGIVGAASGSHVESKGTVKDEFSRGVKADVQSNLKLLYLCKEDGKRFATAVALSNHLLAEHRKSVHPSLLSQTPYATE